MAMLMQSKGKLFHLVRPAVCIFGNYDAVGC